MADFDQVAGHYASEGIAARILAALRASGIEGDAITPDSLAPLDQLHSRGLEMTRELAEALAPQAGERVLDIGSGVGGPARWIAAKYGCHVTGVDLTPDFCAAAEELNAAARMSDRVRIMMGNALDLPFPDRSFDRAYSQNVVMNIDDKPRFYREAWRVLEPGGLLAMSNIALGAKGNPHYPVPWAETATTSFLSTPEQTQKDVAEAGFEIVRFRDTTKDLAAYLDEQRRRIQAEGPPALGIHILMGERMREYQRNMARNVTEERVATIEILCRKPA